MGFELKIANITQNHLVQYILEHKKCFRTNKSRWRLSKNIKIYVFSSFFQTLKKLSMFNLYEI